MVVADALARIDSVLEAAPMQVQAVPQYPKDSSVTLRDVHFSYDGKTEVIKGVSLDIQPGQTVAFVGPSGGGKSTLANLVCRDVYKRQARSCAAAFVTVMTSAIPGCIRS